MFYKPPFMDSVIQGFSNLGPSINHVIIIDSSISVPYVYHTLHAIKLMPQNILFAPLE